jgi:hypothetical protein
MPHAAAIRLLQLEPDAMTKPFGANCARGGSRR